MPVNILLITADQWRGECLSTLGHPIVKTPNIDSLAKQGVLFKKHFAQATPCAPSRTSLHTGTYMFNHRCVSNGTPVADRLTNWAKEVRKAGYDPSLFGYTDTGLDPTGVDRNDRRLTHYSEPLPGIGYYTPIQEDVSQPWMEYLRLKNYPIPERLRDLYGNTAQGVAWRDGGTAPLPLAIAAEDDETTFMVDKCIEWIGAQSASWVTHLSLLRPHPPFVAPAPYNEKYAPDQMPNPVRLELKDKQAAQHPFLEYTIKQTKYGDPNDSLELQEACASYYGLMSQVDDNLGRMFDYLKSSGQWDNTLIIFTSDHGEQMGDQWLWSKLGFYDASYYVPLIIMDPRNALTRGDTAECFTESVDIMPTMLDWLDLDIPAQCDGQSLMPFVRGEQKAENWRSEVHWEYDFRDVVEQGPETALGISSHACNLSVLRDEKYKYVHFAALPPILFDLENDPGELNNVADEPAYQTVALEMSRKMMSWRMNYADRGFTEILLTDNGPVERRSTLA